MSDEKVDDTSESKTVPDATIQVKTNDSNNYTLKEKCIIFTVLAALTAASVFMISNAIYNYTHKDNQIETQQDMQNPVKVKDIIAKDFGLKIDNTQAKEIAKTMQDGDKTSKYYKEPDNIITVQGKNVMPEAETFKKKTGGAIVTGKQIGRAHV